MKRGALLVLLCLGCTTGPKAGDDSASPIDLPTPSVRLHDELGSLVYVAWNQPEAATTWVRYSFDGTELESPHVATAAGPTEALALGVPYGVEVTLQVVSEGPGGESPPVTITTDPLPEGLPVPQSIVSDAAALDPSLHYLYMSISERPGRAGIGLTERWWVFILDRQGRVVWARRTPSGAASLQPRISSDGRSLLLDESTYWGSFDDGAGSQVLEMKIDGSVVRTWPTPGMHHPYVQLGDGTLVWGAWDHENETLEEVTLDGTRRRIWSCEDALAERGLTGDCASNTIAWRESDDTFLFSMYSLFTVFEIDHASGATLRTYGQLAGSWAMDPPRANFWWQHGLYWTEAGTLLVSTYEDAEGSDTVVREYAPDAGSETLREVWNMGLGDGIWGQYMGEPHRLGNGSTLHNTGSEPRLREGTPDGEIVWDVDFRANPAGQEEAWMGRSTPVSDLYAFLPDAG